MHITINEDLDKIKECFNAFRELQERTVKHIQITEFDMCLGRTDVLKVFGSDPKVTLEEVYQYKEEKVALISKIINDSHVKLDRISY